MLGGGNLLSSSSKGFTLAEDATHVARLEDNRFSAFTLAEVLVTLGIIGVVAAMTMPVLIQKHQKMVLKQQFKKSYSVMQQAYQKVYADLGYNLECYYWDKNPYGNSVCTKYNDAGICIESTLADGSPKPADYGGRFDECGIFMSHLEKNLNILKKCNGNAYPNKCIPKYKGLDTYYKDQDDSLTDDYLAQKTRGCGNWNQKAIENNRIAYVFNDGTILLLYDKGPSLFAIDVNGMKGPNKWGHDLFAFGTRGGGNKASYVATNLSCNPTEAGGMSTGSMLINAYK